MLCSSGGRVCPDIHLYLWWLIRGLAYLPGLGYCLSETCYLNFATAFDDTVKLQRDIVPVRPIGAYCMVSIQFRNLPQRSWVLKMN